MWREEEGEEEEDKNEEKYGGVVEVTGQEAARPPVMSSRSLEDLEGEMCPSLHCRPLLL